MASPSFRPFRPEDAAALLEVFDLNAPEFFALNERDDYEAFLSESGGTYEVCVLDGELVGAFGLLPGESRGRAHVRWILLDPGVHGRGLGSHLMRRIVELARASDTEVLEIAASHRSEGFFARFDAVARVRTEDGWGPGMHRVDMELDLRD